jgi:hypothetical protein
LIIEKSYVNDRKHTVLQWEMAEDPIPAETAYQLVHDELEVCFPSHRPSLGAKSPHTIPNSLMVPLH